MIRNIIAKRSSWYAAIAVVLIAGVLATAAGRRVVGAWLATLRVQKVQAVNLDF